MNYKITFSHQYWKLGIINNPMLMDLAEVKEVNLEDLPKELKEMDTRYYEFIRLGCMKIAKISHYELPKKGKYLALGFKGDIAPSMFMQSKETRIWRLFMNELFGKPMDLMTLRSRYGRYGDKLPYFRDALNKEVEIVIEGED